MRVWAGASPFDMKDEPKAERIAGMTPPTAEGVVGGSR